jgi:hypothetical protein
MVMIYMCSILMGYGLMIPISQLGPCCSYLEFWKKLQFVNEKSFGAHSTKYDLPYNT